MATDAAQAGIPATQSEVPSRGGARRLQTLERGLVVLEWLVSHPATASVRQASEALDMDYNNCYRLVNTLVVSGYLVRTRGQLRPGPAFVRLWPAYLREEGPKELLSLAAELRDRTRESAYVNIWDGHDVVLVHAVDGLEHVRVTTYDPGYKGAAYARATGKAILAYLSSDELDRYLATHELSRRTENTIVDEGKLRAHLKEISCVGLAYDYEEMFPGACAIGAPLFGPSGEILGGIAISLPASRVSAHLETFSDQILWAGERGSRILGYKRAYPKLAAECRSGRAG